MQKVYPVLTGVHKNIQTRDVCRRFEGSSVSTGSMCVDGLRGPQLVQAVCV